MHPLIGVLQPWPGYPQNRARQIPRTLLGDLQVAPAGTPAAVVKKLNTSLCEIIDSSDVQARFKNVGFEGFSSTPEELAAFIKVQLGVWEKMVKDADIKPN